MMPAEDRAALLQGDYSPDWQGWIEHFEQNERENEPVFVPETRRLYVDIQPTHNIQRMTEADYRAMWRRSLIKVAAGIILVSIFAVITS